MGIHDSGYKQLFAFPAMVVYRGDTPWRAPLDIRELVETPPGTLASYVPSMRYLLLEETKLSAESLEQMSNLVAEMFRIEKSATLTGSVAALVSFFRWTEKAGAQQDSLKRAMWMWFRHAQKAAKIIDDDAVETMAIEELEPMLSERIEKWQQELKAQGRTEGEAELMIRLCEKSSKRFQTMRGLGYALSRRANCWHSRIGSWMLPIWMSS